MLIDTSKIYGNCASRYKGESDAFLFNGSVYIVLSRSTVATRCFTGELKMHIIHYTQHQHHRDEQIVFMQPFRKVKFARVCQQHAFDSSSLSLFIHIHGIARRFDSNSAAK